MSNPLGVAVVGTGFIGPVHVEGLRRAGLRVTGILGSTPEKSVAAAETLGLPRGYRDLREILTDDDVQSVHITTPNRFHFDQASAVIQSRRHVMCEKPLAMDSGESAELVRQASATGIVAGVNYNIRYYPLCREAAERRRSGQLGDVFHVAGSYVQDWLFHPTDFNWRVLSADGGELRAVADIGTHWLDLIQHITGLEIAEVCADLQTVYPERQRPTGGVETFSSKLANPTHTQSVKIDTDDYGCVMLRFNNGARGMVWVSQVTAGRKNCLRFEIAASNQSLEWNSEAPNQLWIGHRDTANETLIRDPGLMSPGARAISSYPGGHNEGFPDTFKQCFREFYAYIAAGDFTAPRHFPTFEDGHREIALCEAILASHRQQAWVRVGSHSPG
jgi:predicted dehydrogenase